MTCKALGCRASVQDMTTDGSSGTQQLQPGLRQVAGTRQPSTAAAGATPQQTGQQPHAVAGAIAFASAGTLDKPVPTAEQKPGTRISFSNSD